MADRSKIEWTDASWTPIRARWLTRDPSVVKIGWHCEHVSEACRNCYAEAMNRRLGTGLDFKPGSRDDIYIFLDEKMLLQPVHRRAVDACRRDLEATLADPRMGAFLRQKLDRLRGKNGACWCNLCTRHAHAGKAFDEECRDCSPCHCDPLLELANRPICEEVG